MKKILFTRKLIKKSEEYASSIFKAKFNVDDKFSSENILAEYLGKYEFRQGISEVIFENGKLCINAPSRLEAVPEKLTLVPVSEDSFMTLYDGQSVSFVRNNDGKITHFLNGGYPYIKI